MGFFNGVEEGKENVLEELNSLGIRTKINLVKLPTSSPTKYATTEVYCITGYINCPLPFNLPTV